MIGPKIPRDSNLIGRLTNSYLLGTRYAALVGQKGGIVVVLLAIRYTQMASSVCYRWESLHQA